MTLILNYFDLLNKHEFNYAIIKSRYSYHKTLPISDLDILIDENDSEKLHNILVSIGFKLREPKGTFPKMFFYVDPDSKTLFHIHTHLIFLTREKKYKILPFNDFALSTRIFDTKKNLYFIDPKLELIIQVFLAIESDSLLQNIIRQLMRKRFYTEKRAVRIGYLTKLINPENELHFRNDKLDLFLKKFNLLFSRKRFSLLQYWRLKKLFEEIT